MFKTYGQYTQWAINAWIAENPMGYLNTLKYLYNKTQKHGSVKTCDFLSIEAGYAINKHKRFMKTYEGKAFPRVSLNDMGLTVTLDFNKRIGITWSEIVTFCNLKYEELKTNETKIFKY